MSKTTRRRRYAAVTAAIILLGLFVHFHGAPLNARLRDSLGDALWAGMIAAALSALLPGKASGTRYFIALLICYAVEFSQLWHTATLDQFRATRMGALMLGSGFDWRDLIAYACGIVMFAWLDQHAMFRSQPRDYSRAA